MYYPLLVNLAGKMIIVAGGGQVAERKINGLLSTGALITVISPKITPLIQQWVNEGVLQWKKERYRAEHLSRAELVFAATNETEGNLRIYEDATALNVWVNMAERPELSDVIIPASFRRGKLVISVSTSGAGPLVARKIKEELEEIYDGAYEPYLDTLEVLRGLVKQHIADRTNRMRWFKQIAEMDWLHLIRAGKLEQVKAELIQEIENDRTWRP